MCMSWQHGPCICPLLCPELQPSHDLHDDALASLGATQFNKVMLPHGNDVSTQVNA